MKIPMNDQWGFTPEFDEGLLENSIDQGNLQRVRLPHTAEETPFNCFDEGCYQKIMGYRKVIYGEEAWEGKVLHLTFEGAAHRAEVFLNGTKVTTHNGGYTAFTADLSPYIEIGGDNILVVKLDSRESLNMPPFGYVIDFLTYGGLYREVYLEVLPKTYVKDVFVRTEKVLETEKTLIAEVLVEGDRKSLEAAFILRDKNGENPRELDSFPLNDEKTIHEFSLKNIELWDLESPKLYTLEVRLSNGARYEVTFGFREMSLRPQGFFLNGKRIKIRGLNRHQSYPYVGYAMPQSPQELDADILKYELGVNGVRTAHYPQSKHFIRRCDEIGLLVFTEIPGWQHIGDKAWQEIALEQVREMVLQYRNHPSIFIWGVRINESSDHHDFYRATNAVARALDPTRPTGGVRYIKNSELLEDVYTYNDFSHVGENPGIEKRKKVTGEKQAPYLVTEFNGHMYPTKAFDDEAHRRDHALRHARVLNDIYKEEDVAGGFGWVMFDYNTHKDFGSGDRICYHGVMDYFRNKKLAGEVYAAQQDKEPVLALSSNMDVGEYPGSIRGDLYAFTNGDEVRLYKNHEFIRSFTKDNSPYKDLPAGPIPIDDVLGDRLQLERDLSPGKRRDLKKALLAVAKHGPNNLPLSSKLLAGKLMLWHRMTLEEIGKYYTKYIGDWGQEATTYRVEALKEGKVIARREKKTMETVNLSLRVDRTTLLEGDTYDVATVRIQALSDSGNLLSYLQEPLVVEVEGPIEIIGPKILSLRGGMTGTYVKSQGKPGRGKVRIRLDNRVKKTLDFVVETKGRKEGRMFDDPVS